METKTTLYMHKAILIKLNNASKRMNKSRTYIIRILLRAIMDDIEDLNMFWRHVRYQADDAGDNWHRFHISFREDEYEYCMDLRKVCKLSLSRIVALAVEKYLDILLKRFSQEMFKFHSDNCLFKNYAISPRKVDGIWCWRFYWGVPRLEYLNDHKM